MLPKEKGDAVKRKGINIYFLDRREAAGRKAGQKMKKPGVTGRMIK